MAVVVQVKRSPFQLPICEVTDEILQYVLYHRRQVPILVSALLNDSGVVDHADVDSNSDFVQLLTRSHGKKIEKFRRGYLATRDGIRRLFGLRFASTIQRIAIVIGSSPSVPVDVYIINLQRAECQSRDNDENAEVTGEIPLTSSERRKITRQLIDQGFCYRRGDTDLKEMAKAAKTFLLVQADRELSPPGFLPRPDLDLLRYCVADDSNGKRLRCVNWTVLQVTRINSDGDEMNSAKASELTNGASCAREKVGSNEDQIWYQAQEAMLGFDE